MNDRDDGDGSQKCVIQHAPFYKSATRGPINFDI
jgi:hypothetical protein